MDDAEVMRIAEGLAELKGTVATFMSNWQTQDERAIESRGELHRKMTELQVTVGGHIRTVADVTAEVAALRTEIEMLKGAYQQGRGIIWALRGAGVVLVGFLGWLFAHVFPLLTFKGRMGP